MRLVRGWRSKQRAGEPGATGDTSWRPDVLDTYSRTFPSAQNAVDLFAGSWSSRVPLDGVATGAAGLFDDPRIHWLVEQAGALDGAEVLELGPLEGGHSAMLAAAGARVTAVEANARAYLKCLVVKELLGLDRCRFLHGDFVAFLEAPPQRYDLVVASGVLYHAPDPVRLLELIAAVTDRVGLWTHYYDREVIGANADLARHFAGAEPDTVEYHGRRLTLHRRQYLEALRWQGFCGGPEPYALWFDRPSLLDAIDAVGFTQVQVGTDDRAHVNGPNLLLFATR